MPNRARINSNYIVLISLGLVAGTIITALLAKSYPLFSTKALYICQQFVSNTLFKIPHLLPGAFIFAVWVTFLPGVISFIIQLIKTHILLKNISRKRIGLTDRLLDVAESLSLIDKIQLIGDSNLYSFCFGLFRPRIAITTGLVNNLSDKELEAVLLHEQVHLQNGDPAKILLGKTIAATFFFLPIFNELYRSMEAGNELIADQLTTQTQNDSRFLRGALRKIIAQPQVSLATVPAIFHPDHIEIRVRRLVDSTTRIKFNMSYASVITSVVFVVTSLFFLQTPVDAVHTEYTPEPSFFLCSTDSVCGQECHHNSQISPVSSPEQLFSSQSPKYAAPSYK